MRIGIEAQRIFRKKKYGMDTVAVELINHLQKIDTVNEYFIFVKDDEDESAIQETENFKIVKTKRKPYPIWEQLYLPKLIKKYNLDLLHCTSNTAPLFCSVPIILTLHDVIFLESVDVKEGSMYHRVGNLYRRFIVPRIIHKVRAIGTVSHNENKIATDRLGLEKGSICTVHNSVGKHFHPAGNKEIENVKTKYGLDGDYIFALGNLVPRKNSNQVLISFIEIARQNPDVVLFISDLKRDHIESVVKNHGGADILDRVQNTGYIPEDELPAVYSGARAFVFPSLREGFGIPILESMACGTPVVTSNTSSMPEVAGDAAILVDPKDSSQVADALSSIIQNRELGRELSEKGLERAKDFSWENTARLWLEVYERSFN